MSADGASRRWSPESAYTEALAVVHAALEESRVAEVSFDLDHGVSVDTGRHGVVEPARRGPKGFHPQATSRGEHAQRSVPEPLVNGTTAADLFALLQRHGDLDIPLDAGPRVSAASRDEQPYAGATSLAATLEQAAEGRLSVPRAHTDEMRSSADGPAAEPAERIPGRRTGFIPLPEDTSVPETRSERMRAMIAQWREARELRSRRSQKKRGA